MHWPGGGGGVHCRSTKQRGNEGLIDFMALLFLNQSDGCLCLLLIKPRCGAEEFVDVRGDGVGLKGGQINHAAGSGPE